MLKNILLQFTDLYNMTCAYGREEDKLSACIETTPSCIHKKKSKLCFCVKTRMTWPWISESTFPSKISSLWPSNDLSTMFCYQSFLVQFLLSTYSKVLAFLDSIWSLFNSKAASRVPLIIFIVLMVSLTAYWRAWPWQCVKWACDSISFICVATRVLAPNMLDVSSWH